MGACIKLDQNTAHIKGVQNLNGMDLVGSDLRSSAALIIAAIMAKSTSRIFGLEHLDRGYENFESKLYKLGIEIKREFHNKILIEKEYKLNSHETKTAQFKAA